jgi:N-acetylmuramic acid 6-phosphate etherase
MRAGEEDGLGLLSTEARNAATEGFDALSALGMVLAMHQADLAAVGAVGRALPQVAAVVEAVAERLRGGGRLVYVGAGTSGRLGVLDASECPPTFQTAPELVQGVIAGGERALRHAVEGAEDDPALGAEAMRERGVAARDVVVGIAASGRTPFVLGAMVFAAQVGALTVGVSCVPGSAVERAGELAITIDTGAEVLTGSTRLKAGTATKLVLNMISTAVLARLGYVHGNLMVNVQPTNGKLRDRAVRIVAELAGLGRLEAEAALERAGGEVKTAVVAAVRGVGAGEARRRVADAGGVLRRALRGEGSGG